MYTVRRTVAKEYKRQHTHTYVRVRTRDSILLFSFLLLLRLVPLLLPRESFTPPPYNAALYIAFIISLSLSLSFTRSLMCIVQFPLLYFFYY